jgi:hypothetical protein
MLIRTWRPVDVVIDIYVFGIAAYALVAVAIMPFQPKPLAEQAAYIFSEVAVDAMLWPMTLARLLFF